MGTTLSSSIMEFPDSSAFLAARSQVLAKLIKSVEGRPIIEGGEYGYRAERNMGYGD